MNQITEELTTENLLLTPETSLPQEVNELKNTIAEWQVYRTRFLIKAKPLTQPMSFIDALGREHRGQPGDYLIESSDGSRSIQRRAIFEDIYVPLGQPQPIASECQRDITPHEIGRKPLSDAISVA